MYGGSRSGLGFALYLTARMQLIDALIEFHSRPDDLIDSQKYRSNRLYYKALLSPVRDFSVSQTDWLPDTALVFESDDPVTYQHISQHITQNQRSFLSRVAWYCAVDLSGLGTKWAQLIVLNIKLTQDFTCDIKVSSEGHKSVF